MSGTTIEDREVTTEGSWRARPLLAGTVRGVIAVLPIALAFTTSLAMVRLLPRAEDGVTTLGLAALVLAVSTLVLLVTERLSRRLVPLSLLLGMSMMFPNQAPPRYRVARKAASVRHLREQVERAHAKGRKTTPIRAAEDILTLIAGLTVHDRRTRGHSERVRVYTDLLTEQLGLSPRDRERLRWASLIHDIGKLEVPAAILNKRGRPTEDEWQTLRAHPTEGARIAAGLLPWLGEWGAAIEHHHERWDGAGYPHGLAGDRISTGGRVVAVADAYETMTAVRSYKSAMTHVAAREELARCAGSQFDPNVVRAFLDIPLTHLVRVAGPVSWLIQLPLLRHLQPIASSVAPQLVASSATVATAAVVGATALATTPGGLPARAAVAGAVMTHVPAASAEAVDATPAADPGEASQAPTSSTGAVPEQAPQRGTATEAPSVPDADPAAADTALPDLPDTRTAQPRGIDAAPGVEPSLPDPSELAEPLVDPTSDVGGLADELIDTVEDLVSPAPGDIRNTLDDITGELPIMTPTPSPAETVRETIRDIENEVREVVEETPDTPLDPVVEEVLPTAAPSAPPSAPSLPPAPSAPSLPEPPPLPVPTPGGGVLGGLGS